MAAKKKASKKKVAAKNVDNTRGKGSTVKEVMIDAPDEEAESAPPPAIEEERTLKVVDGGGVKYYTQSEYDKKFGKAK